MPLDLGLMPVFDRSTITDRDWVTAFLRMAEESGVESVWTVEHVVMGVDYEPLYEYSEDGRAPTGPTTVMPDPLEWLGFAAAVTERVRLGTSVVIASQHSAAILAKRVATLDALSNGRVLLGVGIGWQKEEYAAIGVPYRDRGRRLDECIEGMRALWANGPARYAGKYVQLEDVVCDTKPATPGGVPILIGGSSSFAARRAGRLGNGFLPYVISPEDLAERVEEMRAVARESGRDPDALEVSVVPGSYAPTPMIDVDLARRYADAGASRLIVNAQECGSMEVEAIRRFVGDFQERVLAKL
jgi:probable F420-dependent oxidoreductase